MRLTSSSSLLVVLKVVVVVVVSVLVCGSFVDGVAQMNSDDLSILDRILALTSQSPITPPIINNNDNTFKSARDKDPKIDFVVVQTKNGGIRGVKTTIDVKFLGIPYAMPPMDDLRWRSPTPFPPWNGTRDALEYAHACPQKENVFIKEHSEDCLYLNVFTPANASGDPLPVMLFIHGGAYEQGGASVPIYSGEYLVELERVIVVTFNYRLGSLGFLGGDIMRLRTEDGSMGNYGIQDQRMAMKWVKDNIDAFNGDSNRIMIFGESAGAGAIATHLINPRSTGLFNAAVMESGAFSIWQAVRNTSAEATFDKFVRATGCVDSPDILGCLVALPIAQLLEAQASVTVTSASLNWAPTVDGVEILDWPETMAQQGLFASTVPCIVGSNSAEAAALVMQVVGSTLNVSTYTEMINLLFGAAALLIDFEYPLSEYESPWWALEAMITDALFACPARRTVRWMDKKKMSTFQYFFGHTPLLSVIPGCIAPCHASELPYVFHVDSLLANDAESELSTNMVHYWASMAASGRPAHFPGWPEYNRFFDRALILNETISVVQGMRAKQCNFWDFVEPQLPSNLTAAFIGLIDRFL